MFILYSVPYADFEDDDENIVVDMSELEAIDDDEEDNDESEENNNDEPTPTLVNIQASPRIVGNKPTNAPFTTDSRPMKPEELESLDDETILKNVFQALSGGKGHVSLKDLLNWDFVLDLFGEGLLDEEELVFMMSDCGGHRKGVDLPAFDKLVDSLVEKYSELEGDEDEDTDNESTNGMSIADDNKIADSIFEGSDEGNESSELRDDEDVLDIDVGEAFDKLSKGKNFVTLRSFMKWDVVSTLIREGYLVEGEIEEMLELIKVEDSDRMDIVTFENLVTELASRFTADDDEDDDDGDESDDLNTDEFADIDESGNIMSMNESTTDNESDDNDKGSEAEGDVFGDDDDTYDTNTEQLLKDLKSLIDKEESEAKGRNKK